MSQTFPTSLNRFRSLDQLSYVAATILLGGVIFGFGVSAQAQEAPKPVPPAFREVELKLDEQARNAKKDAKNEAIKSSGNFNKQSVVDYYRGVLIPYMTSLKEPELGNKARIEIREDLDKAEKAGGNLQSEMNALMLEDMPKIINGPFQPSATINATQILCRLNKPRTKPNAIPEPLSETLNILFMLFKDGKNDGIRAAALVGLERHVDLAQGTWDDRRKQGFADALFATLNAPKPAGRNARTDAWLRGRTIELLLKIKHSKEAELFQYATKALANPATDPILLERALLVTGQYPVTPITPAELNPTLATPMKYLLTKLTAWKKEAGEAQYQNFGGGGETEMLDTAAGDGSVVDDGSGDDLGMGKKAKKKAEPKANPYTKQPVDVVAKRRALHELLEIIRYGYSGVRFGGLPTDAKSGLALQFPEGEGREIVAESINAIKDLQDALNSPTIIDRATLVNEITPKIDKLMGDVEFLLNALGAPNDVPPTEPTSPVATTN